MSAEQAELEVRVLALEHGLRRSRALAATLTLFLVAVVASGLSGRGQASDEVRTRRLVVVDDSNRVRVVIAQDPTTFRRSRAAGLTVFDRTGTERGGLSTMDDGSVVFGMDAPLGVGAPMRDRIGLVVERDGSSHVMLIDNSTRAVAKLQSDSSGVGGVQVFSWDMAHKRVHIRTVTYGGDLRDSVALDQ